MNILNISIDKTLVGGNKLGDAIERHRKYGGFLNHLDIIVYTRKKDGLSEYKISDNVVGYPTNSKNKLFFVFDVIRIFKLVNKKYKIDLIQTQDPFLTGLIGLYLKKVYKIKLQINFHGDFWQNNNWLKERTINFIFLLISKITVPIADAIRVMSSGQKEKLISAGINKNKIRVISTPVDLNKYLNCQSYNQSTKNVLHVGRNDKVKDYDTLVKSFMIVKDKIRDVVFMQVGADSEIKEMMSNHNFQDIEVLGNKTADELIDIYSKSNIVVLSSMSESFGKVLIEANAASRPVVSTATTGAKEIIKDGYNGYLVPIGDEKKLAEKIVYLLDHPEEANVMGNNGRKLVSERYGDNTAKIVNFWRDTVNKK